MRAIDTDEHAPAPELIQPGEHFVTVIIKPDEYYTFTVLNRPAERMALIELVGQYALNPELSFSKYDAAMVVDNLRRRCVIPTE